MRGSAREKLAAGTASLARGSSSVAGLERDDAQFVRRDAEARRP
jgi:Trp operon repressor